MNPERPVLNVRADCSPDIGCGHVMRCLGVAEAISKSGTMRVRFIMAPNSDASPLQAQGLEVVRLSQGQTGIEYISNHASPDDGPLLLDSYDVETKDLEKLRKDGFRIAMFDDGQRLESYPCDVVVDSAPNAAALPYRGLPETRFFLGAGYFPLRPEFLKSAPTQNVRDRVGVIVVTFGGNDPDDVTLRMLEVLAGIKGDFKILTVLGPGYEGKAGDAAGNDPRVRLLRGVANMATVLAGADIAISGSGGTASELAFLGVPMVLLALSTDQVPVAGAMKQAGAAVSLGFPGEIDNAAIAAALTDLIGDLDMRGAMRLAGRALIDGQGADRIAEAILSIPAAAGKMS